MKDFFKNWGWEDTWLTLLIIITTLAGGLGAKAITADHRPKFYRLANSNTSSGSHGFCVEAYREWTTNDVVFCSDDVNKSIAVMTQLNASIK